MKKIIIIVLVGIVLLSACKKEKTETQNVFKPWSIQLDRLNVLRNYDPDRKVESFNTHLVRGLDTIESFNFHYSVPYAVQDPNTYVFVNKGVVGDKIYIKVTPLGTFTWLQNSPNYIFMFFSISNYQVLMKQSTAPVGYFNYEVTVHE